MSREIWQAQPDLASGGKMSIWTKKKSRARLEHVAQKWAPVLSFPNMRNQYVRACCVNSNERDML
jgi:hypothetical protein